MLGTDVDTQRLQVAGQIGATRHSISTKMIPSNVSTSLGDGYGADLIVDCTGVSIALQFGAGNGTP